MRTGKKVYIYYNCFEVDATNLVARKHQIHIHYSTVQYYQSFFTPYEWYQKDHKFGSKKTYVVFLSHFFVAKGQTWSFCYKLVVLLEL